MKAKLQLAISLTAIIMVAGLLKSYAQFDIGQAATAPTIDGIADAGWSTEPKYVAVDPTTWTPNANLTSLDDCSFSWSATWDADSLYVIAYIKDDIVTTGVLGSGVSSWMNDNVEISIYDPTGSGKNVFFRFAYDRDGEDLGLLDDPAKPTPVGSHFATSVVENGWIAEAAIPWNILSNIEGVDFSGYPAIDKVLNMNVIVADLDLPDAISWDQLSGHIMWPKGWASTEVNLKAAATVDGVAPGIVSNLAVSNIKFNSADLSWTIPADADIQGYLMLANDAPKQFIADPAATTATLAGLTAETSYTVSIITVDAQNISTSVSIDFTTGKDLDPQNLNVEKYGGAYENPFEDLDFWEGVTPVAVSYLAGDANINETDLAGNMKITWTDANLYMQYNVTDENIVNGDEAQPWTNDAVEYHFDMGGERDGSSTEDAFENYDPNNFQYRAIPYTQWQTGSTPAPVWTDVNMATYDYFGTGVSVIGYSIEINFPFASLNASSGLTFTPAVGQKISFDAKIVDKDADGTAGTLSWSSFSHSDQYKNDSEFGLLKFVLGTGIDTKSLNNLVQVTPNPANDFVNIAIQNSFTGTISIIDLSGRVIISQNTENFSGNKMISLSNISKGLYVVSLESTNNEAYRTTIVIE